MRSRIISLMIVGAIATGVVAAPALAQETAEDQTQDVWEEARQEALAGIKDHAAWAIEHRLATLDELEGWVHETEHVSPVHADALLADFDAAASGLTALGEEIQAASDIEEALRLSALIATDYRVYLVIVPKTAEVLIGDSLVVAGDHIQEAGVEVQEAIDWLADAGLDTTEIQEALDRSMRHAAAAVDEADGVAASVVGLDASDWPSPAGGALESGRVRLEASADEVYQSVKYLREAIHLIHQALRQLR